MEMLNKTDKDFLLDGMTWSFSRVNAYSTCPRMFYLEYLQQADKDSNAFAEWGSLCHSLFERYYTHKLEFYELSAAYEAEYEEAVPTPFPFAKMGEGYYRNGKEFFDSFEGDYQNYKVVGAELKVELEIRGRPFIGFIDLLLQDKDGHYKVVDFKSKSAFKSKEEKKHYALQLYLYSRWVFDHYGEYPIEMEFNMFRARQHEVIKFDLHDMLEAEQWFTKTIDAMYADHEFLDKIEMSGGDHGDFFCDTLCSVGAICPRSKKGEEQDAGRERNNTESKGKARRPKLPVHNKVPKCRGNR